MAIDSQEQRMSAVGAGRPWMRSKLPGAIDAPWRAASGHSYAGVTISAPSDFFDVFGEATMQPFFVGESTTTPEFFGEATDNPSSFGAG